MNLDKSKPSLSKYDFNDKEKLLRNCVHPVIGEAIINKAFNIEKEEKAKQLELFT